jgi:hypothetical protein
MKPGFPASHRLFGFNVWAACEPGWQERGSCLQNGLLLVGKRTPEGGEQ